MLVFPVAAAADPPAPANLHTAGSTFTTATVAWDAPADPTVTQFNAYLTAPVSGYGGGENTANGSTSTTFRNLACGDTYTANVSLRDSNGIPGPKSSVQVATSACTEPKPPAPTNLHVTGTGGGQATLAYDPPADPSIAYQGVSLSGPSPQITERPRIESVSDGYTAFGIVCGESYQVAFAWINDEGSQSAPATATASGPPCPDPPAGPAPNGMHTTGVTATAIGLAWNDYNFPTNVSGWRLLTTGGSVNTKTYGRSTGQRVLNLTCATTYSFTFSWVFSDGTISQPSTAAFGTSPCPVDTPAVLPELPVDVTPPSITLKRTLLRARSHTFSVPLACGANETDCIGSITVAPRRRKIGRRTLPAALARANFEIAPGATTAVLLKLTRAARRALPHGRALPILLTVRAHDDAGNSATKRFAARLLP